VAYSDKHLSLLRKGINYDLKNLIIQSPGDFQKHLSQKRLKFSLFMQNLKIEGKKFLQNLFKIMHNYHLEMSKNLGCCTFVKGVTSGTNIIKLSTAVIYDCL
jgi:hypothetical protein